MKYVLATNKLFLQYKIKLMEKDTIESFPNKNCQHGISQGKMKH